MQRLTIAFVVGILVVSAGWITFQQTAATETQPRPHVDNLIEVVSADRNGRTVTVAAKPLREGIEFMALPELHIGDNIYTGNWTFDVAADVILFTFNVANEASGITTLVLPSVNTPIAFETREAIGVGTLVGPENAQYRVVERKVDEETGIVHYTIDTPGAPAISIASASVMGERIFASDVGTAYDLSDNPIRGILRFSPSATALVDENEIELVINEFRRTVEVREPLPALEG